MKSVNNTTYSEKLKNAVKSYRVPGTSFKNFCGIKIAASLKESAEVCHFFASVRYDVTDLCNRALCIQSKREFSK